MRKHLSRLAVVSALAVGAALPTRAALPDEVTDINLLATQLGTWLGAALAIGLALVAWNMFKRIFGKGGK